MHEAGCCETTLVVSSSFFIFILGRSFTADSGGNDRIYYETAVDKSEDEDCVFILIRLCAADSYSKEGKR